MITVEYLIFNDKKEKICTDRKSFESLLQTDSDIIISNNKIKYKNIIDVDYYLEVGDILESNNTYFNISLSINSDSDICSLIELLKSFKKRFNILTNSPQVLFDGVSKHYACQAYPLLYEIENLMRKLLTKFMLINAGMDWKTIRIPDDVSHSLKREEEVTYLYNLDFIQLKDIIFSEKYSSQKDRLIEKLKSTHEFDPSNLRELKELLPISNWTRYFAETIGISSKKLSVNWTELYKMRCKVAHNKIFSKADYEKTVRLIEETKPALLTAIQGLRAIDIDHETKDSIEENIFGSLDYELGKFLAVWNEFEKTLFSWIAIKTGKEIISSSNSIHVNLKYLGELQIIDFNTLLKIEELQLIRNKIVHFDESITKDEIIESISDLENMIHKIKKFEGNILSLEYLQPY